MTLRVLFIHGLRTDPDGLAGALRALRATTREAEVSVAAWGSTGSAVRDLPRVLADRATGRFRRPVSEALEEFVAGCRFGTRSWVVGHSWGCILGRDAVGLLSEADKGRLAGFVALGSPGTHPVFRNAMVTQLAPLPGRAYGIYRENDFVAAFRGRVLRPDGWHWHVLEASDNPHSPIGYFRSAAFRRLLAKKGC